MKVRHRKKNCRLQLQQLRVKRNPLWPKKRRLLKRLLLKRLLAMTKPLLLRAMAKAATLEATFLS